MLTWPSPGSLIAVAAVLSAVAALVAAAASWRTSVEQDRQITIIEAWSTANDTGPSRSSPRSFWTRT